jgi:hypothetical protein
MDIPIPLEIPKSICHKKKKLKRNVFEKNSCTPLLPKFSCIFQNLLLKTFLLKGVWTTEDQIIRLDVKTLQDSSRSSPPYQENFKEARGIFAAFKEE